MPNAPTPFDPIAQLVAKYQSNGHQIVPAQQQLVSQSQQKKGWTGFSGKTLWDWLGVLLVPLILGAGTIIVTAQQSVVSQRQHESDLSIANNQLQEALLKTFRDDINHLVFDQHLLTAKFGDPVLVMAQSYTNDALRKLDLSRRVMLVRFLNDLHLITSTKNNFNLPLISLSGVDLRGADLQGANLGWANLEGVDLRGADLKFADLQGANLKETILRRADLEETNLEGANLGWARVTPEQLGTAGRLKGAILPDRSSYPSSSYPILNHREPTS